MVNEMKEKNELLMHIYDISYMGSYSTNKLLTTLKNKDNKIKKLLEDELQVYDLYKKKSEKLIKKAKLELPAQNIMSKMMSSMGIMMETMKDNSDAAIASMLAEGFTMGIVEMEAKIKNYKEEVDKNTLKLAKELLKFQQKEIENLKTFM